MNVQISAVIITYNEERNIRRCLESLAGVADEIVVVDSYSSDRTEEICLSCNARFIRHRFVGYSEQKNWANLQANSPFILSLDADEALSDKLRESILRVKENWTHDAYYFNRLTNYCGKWIRHTSWYPSRKLRLWDARKGDWGGLDVHENFNLNKHASKKFLRGDLLHYSYYSISEHVAQMNKYSSLLARSYYESGRKAGFIKILLHPLWRFFRDYFLKAGFLDGYSGIIVSVNSAHEVFLKYVKLRNISKSEALGRRNVICFVNTQRTWGGGEKWNHDVIGEMHKLGYPTLLISSLASPLSRRLSNAGIKIHEVRRSRMKFLYPLKIFHLARIFKKEQVGMLLTNVSVDMKTASMAAKIVGVPKIIYRRSTAIPVENSWTNRYLFRKVLTHVIANSEETKRTILAKNERLVPENKIKVIYNGIQASSFERKADPLYMPVDSEIILGFAGRLSVEKGLHLLLKMMGHLREKKIQFKLLIAGEGKLKEELEDRAKSLGVDHMVEFLGFVDNMSAFYNSIDILILPSKFEGFGYVLVEAMASRKPVVAFDVKSSQEIVEHEQTGYLVPQGEVAQMAERVLELAGDKALRDLMGERGRARVEDLFSFDRKVKEIIDLLQPSSP